MTPDDNRIDLDAMDYGDLQSSLAKDIQEAAKTAKDRQTKDAAHEKRAAQAAKDARLKLGLVIAGTLLVILIAFWMTIGKSSRNQPPVQTNNYHPSAAPTTGTVAPRPNYPTAPINRAPVINSAPSTNTGENTQEDNASPDM